MMYNLLNFDWRSLNVWLKIWITVSLAADFCNAACYFPTEIQGEYVTQSTVDGNQVKYSKVNITEDSIPIWGHCFRKIDKNVILQIDLEESSCFRCFQLKLVARNVLRVLTSDQDYISKCYTTEMKAVASCPQPGSDETKADDSSHTEIVLYKTREWDNQPIRREYCPFTGRFKLSYNIDDGLEDKVECSTKESELDSCPSGSAMNLRFRQCSFENHEVTFECLGHWIGPNQQKYLALMNAKNDDQLGPQYRCAIYQTNAKNGVVNIAFSNDSTCAAINQERIRVKNIKNRGPSPKYSEVLTLHPVPEESWPTDLTYAQFPSWMLGNWQHLRIKKDALLYRDHTSFKTYNMRRLETAGTIPANKHLVFSRTQCDETVYQCVWIEERSKNVLEFQVGSKSSKNRTEEICADEYFDVTRWLTQGKFLNEDKNQVMNTPCSISGDFTGYIPDAAGLCAKLSSECKSQDVMHYQVSACEFDEVYEEREYTCLGHWAENGLVYAFTHRRDVGGYECFVGAMLSDKQIFIKEAGEHCQRRIDPYRYGMELNQMAHCNNVPENSVTNLVSHNQHPKALTPKFPSLSHLPDLSGLDSFNNRNGHNFETHYQSTHYDDESNNGFPGAVQQHPQHQPEQADNTRRSSTARSNTESRDVASSGGAGYSNSAADNEEDNTIPGSSSGSHSVWTISTILITFFGAQLLH